MPSIVATQGMRSGQYAEIRFIQYMRSLRADQEPEFSQGSDFGPDNCFPRYAHANVCFSLFLLHPSFFSWLARDAFVSASNKSAESWTPDLRLCAQFQLDHLLFQEPYMSDRAFSSTSMSEAMTEVDSAGAVIHFRTAIIQAYLLLVLI